MSLFDSTRHIMYSVSYRVLENPDDVEEAMQDAFILMMKHIERIKNLPCPKRAPYCVVIVKNVSKNKRRDQRRHADIDDFSSLASDDIRSNPEHDFFSRFDKEYLEQAISKLDEQDRQVILMRYSKKMTYREIGVALGIREDAAAKRGQRALERLTERYFEELY